MEQVKTIFKHENPETKNEIQIREEVFLNIIFKDLLSDMENSLLNAGYLETDDEEKRFTSVISGLSDEDKKRLFSLPFELRERRFRLFRSEKIPIEAVIEHLVTEAKTAGYTLGYHLSPFDIKKESGRNGIEWKIKGTELDDRDEKLMAYYSLDFDNAYRKHYQKNIFVIRADRGEKSSHKYDSSNNWGRAMEFSVVDRFDFEKIEALVSKEMENHKKENMQQVA